MALHRQNCLPRRRSRYRRNAQPAGMGTMGVCARPFRSRAESPPRPLAFCLPHATARAR